MSRRGRLHIPDLPRQGGELSLDADRARYLARVLRLKPGAELTVFDGSGGEHAAVVHAAAGKSMVLRVGPRHERDLESPLAVQLVQGVARGERMDTVVQKATELGVARITPVVTEHTVVRLDGERASRRLRHWAGIAKSACEQCGRNRLPLIDPPQTLARWLEEPAPPGAARLLLHPRARGGPAPPARTVQLLVGPEGGLSSDERRLAIDRGFAACALGPRVLRTETAAIAALAILQSHWGDLAWNGPAHPG